VPANDGAIPYKKEYTVMCEENKTPETTGISEQTQPAEEAVAEKTAAEAVTDAADEEDNGIIFIPDYGPSDIESDEAQQQIHDIIEQRKSNIAEYVPPEMTVWEKISNFCYRNKPLIILAVAATIIISYIIVVSIPESYDGDVSIYVSSSDYRVSYSSEVQHELEKYADDIDGNGEKLLEMTDFNSAGDNGFIVMANYVLMVDQLNGKPLSMLWVVDKDLFDMMVEGYGEDIFESFEGAPLWIEITCNDLINKGVELGETPRLGICLRRMTDEFSKDKGLCESYENALRILTNLREAHPEMFEPAESAE